MPSAVAKAGGFQAMDPQRDALLVAGVGLEQPYEGLASDRRPVRQPARAGRLLRTAARGEIDAVAAWAVDRVGRGLQSSVSFNKIRARVVDLYLHQHRLDAATPRG